MGVEEGKTNFAAVNGEETKAAKDSLLQQSAKASCSHASFSVTLTLLKSCETITVMRKLACLNSLLVTGRANKV